MHFACLPRLCLLRVRFSARHRPVCCRYSRLCAEIASLLHANGLPSSLLEHVPKRWEMYGDFLLLPADAFAVAEWRACGDELWRVVGRVLGATRVARRAEIVGAPCRYPQELSPRHARIQLRALGLWAQRRACAGPMRSSQVELLLGDSAWVECQQGGCKYSWDGTRCM